MLLVSLLPRGSHLQAGAQDDLTAKIAGLETRVASLEERVAIVPFESPVPGSTIDFSGETITISGSGITVSDAFMLDEGNYVVGVRYEGDAYTSLDIKAAPGSNGFINYASLVSGDDLPVTGEFLVAVYDPGEFVLVADGSGVFTVVIET